jgi:hypothetical protein
MMGLSCYDAMAEKQISIVKSSTIINGSEVCKPDFSRPQCLAVSFENSLNIALQTNGYSQAAVAKDNILNYTSIHQSKFANDGFYGNGSSWISDSVNSWIKIDLGRVVLIDRITFGRDRTNSYDDREPGQFSISAASEDNIYANGDDSNDEIEYYQVFDSKDSGFYGRINGNETLLVAFSPIYARFIKLIVTNKGTAIDEIEIFAVAENSKDCWATYENGKLHIPCFKLKGELGEELHYELYMQYKPLSKPISFHLTGAKPK